MDTLRKYVASADDTEDNKRRSNADASAVSQTGSEGHKVRRTRSDILTAASHTQEESVQQDEYGAANTSKRRVQRAHSLYETAEGSSSQRRKDTGTRRSTELPTAPEYGDAHIRQIGNRTILMWRKEDAELFDRVRLFLHRQQGIPITADIIGGNGHGNLFGDQRAVKGEDIQMETRINIDSQETTLPSGPQYNAEDMEEAMEKFADLPRGDAIVKLVYGVPRYDYIIKYSIKEKAAVQLGQRASFEAALLRRGVFLEYDPYDDDQAMYIKCLGSFELLASEAERCHLRLSTSKVTITHAPQPTGKLYLLRRIWWAMFSHELRERDSDVFRMDRLSEFISVYDMSGKRAYAWYRRRRQRLRERRRLRRARTGQISDDDESDMEEDHKDKKPVEERAPASNGDEQDPMMRDVSTSSLTAAVMAAADAVVNTGVLGVDDVAAPSQTKENNSTAAVTHKKSRTQLPLWLLKERLLTSGLRNLLMHYIISTTHVRTGGRRVGLNYLLAHGVYLSAFPPHDGGISNKGNGDDDVLPDIIITPTTSIESMRSSDDEEKVKKNILTSNDTQIKIHGIKKEYKPPATHPEHYTIPNLRAYLYKTWARGKIFDEQPIDLVRAYFGEKIALYFVWMGFYTLWITIPAIIGIIFFIYGVINLGLGYGSGNDVDVRGVFDNEVTLPWAFCLSLWATTFLEFWTRKNAYVAYEWHVDEYHRKERTRSGFRPTAIRRSPITGALELYVPRSERLIRLFVSGTFVAIWIAAVIASVYARDIISEAIRRAVGDSMIELGPTIISALINLTIIIVLGQVYNFVCKWLNEKENHRTFTQFQNAQIIKRFMFDFFNFYSILFFYGIFNVFTIEDVCKKNRENIDDCQPLPMTNLMVQMIIIFIGRQILSQAQEIAIPYMINLWASRRDLFKYFKAQMQSDNKPKPVSRPQHVKDDKLGEYGFDEYNKMVVQFGFISFFSVAFPLGPLFALLNNALEIRTDALKLLTVYRRPVAFRAENIGMWGTIMQVLAAIAVPVNALIVAFSSQWVHLNIMVPLARKWFDEDPEIPEQITRVGGDPRIWAVRLAFVVIFEHAVLLINLLIVWIVPGEPEAVKIAKEREAYRRAVTSDPSLKAVDVSMEDLEDVHYLRQRRHRRKYFWKSTNKQ